MYSLVMGYAIINIAHIIPITTHIQILDYMLLLLVVVVCSYLVGKGYTSGIFRQILGILKIPYSVNKYIWYDLEGKQNTCVELRDYRNKLVYYGKLYIYEEYQRFPQITLTDCEIRKIENPWDDGVVVKDYSKTNSIVMLDTSKMDYIEIVNEDVSKQK